MYKYNQLKGLRTKSLSKGFTSKNTFILIFSCFDFSDKNVKAFKTLLQKKNIKLYSVKTSFLKKSLEVLPGFGRVKDFLNGPLYIGVTSDSMTIDDFSLVLEKKNKFHVLGLIYNGVLYSGSYLKKFTDFTQASVFNELISILIHKQFTLNFLLGEYLKKHQ